MPSLPCLQALVSSGQTSYLGLAVFAVMMSLIGAFYYLRVVKVMYFDNPITATTVSAPLDVRAVLSINGALVLILGIVPGGRRELQEETGFVAREWARAGVIHPVISYSTEFIEIWFARGLTLGERRLDAGEFLDVFTATPQQLATWCREGAVTDGKTVAGLLWVQQVLSGAWTLDWHATDAGATP
jgi:hypothetical protein